MALKLLFNPISSKFDYVDVAATTADEAPPYEIVEDYTYTTREGRVTVVSTAVRNDGIWINNGIRMFL